MALILVLGALTILTVMLTEFQDETSAELGSAVAERDAVKAEYAARSAVNLSRLLIAAEPTIRNRFTMALPFFAMMMGGKMPQLPVWELAEKMLGAFNDEQGKAAFSAFSGLDLEESKNLGIEGASFKLVIVDEDSKININRPARPGAFYKERLAEQLVSLMRGPQYDEMFENRDRDGQFSDRQTICGAIVDWTDPDVDSYVCDPHSGIAHQAGAEDSFYQMLDRPYPRKNAALDSLQELHLVRGISDDFWGTFVEPDPEQPQKRVLTVWGSDRINVNTGPPQVLLTMACSLAERPAPICDDPMQGLSLLMMLDVLKNFTIGMPVFGSPGAFVNFVQGKGMFGTMLTQMGFEPLRFKSPKVLKKELSAESKVFSVYATGRVKAGKRETHVRIHAVVDFRDAPPPFAPRNLDDLAGLFLPQGAGNDENETDEDVENQLLGFTQKSPAGHIIYYRID